MTIDMDTIKEIHVREAGAWTEIGEVLICIDDAWVPVWNTATALTVSVPATAYGASSLSSAVTVITNTATATASGGTPPYSYAWSRDDSGSPAWTINNPSSAGTTFSVLVSAATVETAEFKCVVTDSLGATVTSSLVYATAENYGGYS